MTSPRLPLIALLISGLAACAAAPKFTPQQLGTALKAGKVSVAPVARPIQLAERTKAQAVGGVVLGSVLGVALGGGSVEASRVLAQTTSQMLPDSYRIDSGTGADLALAKKLADYFVAASPSTPQRNFVLTVHANKWELGYVSFMTSQDYALTYQLQIQVDEAVGDKLEKLTVIDCGNLIQSTKYPQMPYEAWTAEQYKALNAEAGKIVTQCYENGLLSLGLG